MADFDAFVARAGELGLEVALDLALQASPDHPWVDRAPRVVHHQGRRQHRLRGEPAQEVPGHLPAQLRQRPRGHLRRGAAHRAAVDGPRGADLPGGQPAHQAAARSGSGCSRRSDRTDPDVLFLAEAFTRPAMMHALAEIGFHQSYTYFTWRNTAGELTELPARAVRARGRLHAAELLRQHPGHPAPSTCSTAARPRSRCARCWPPCCPRPGACTPATSCARTSQPRPGSEEYLDSEKYQYRPRDWAGAQAAGATLAPFLARLNAIRRAHPALHWLRNLRFHHADQPDLLCFSKRDGADAAGTDGHRAGRRESRPARATRGHRLAGYAGARPGSQRSSSWSQTSCPASRTGGGRPTTCASTRRWCPPISSPSRS